MIVRETQNYNDVGNSALNWEAEVKFLWDIISKVGYKSSHLYILIFFLPPPINPQPFYSFAVKSAAFIHAGDAEKCRVSPVPMELMAEMGKTRYNSRTASQLADVFIRSSCCHAAHGLFTVSSRAHVKLHVICK